jgi:hypothetical protein
LVEPFARVAFRHESAGPAHSTAVADKPSNGAVECRCGFHHSHEFEGGQLRTAQCFGKPKPKQSSVGERIEDAVRQPALAIERFPKLGNKRCNRLECRHILIDPSEFLHVAVPPVDETPDCFVSLVHSKPGIAPQRLVPAVADLFQVECRLLVLLGSRDVRLDSGRRINADVRR